MFNNNPLLSPAAVDSFHAAAPETPAPTWAGDAVRWMGRPQIDISPEFQIGGTVPGQTGAAAYGTHRPLGDMGVSPADLAMMAVPAARGLSAARPLSALQRSVAANSVRATEPQMTAAMVRGNVPASVLRDRPVYTNVRDEIAGWDHFRANQWTGVNHGARPVRGNALGSPEFRANADFMFNESRGIAGYATPATPGRPGSGYIATPDPIHGLPPKVPLPRVLRHEGYHGLVDMLRRGTPMAQVPEAGLGHAIPAWMGRSRSPFVRGLGNHLEEVGARVIGEGGLDGLRGGLRHAVNPGPLYQRLIAQRSPEAARVVRGIQTGYQTVRSNIDTVAPLFRQVRDNAGTVAPFVGAGTGAAGLLAYDALTDRPQPPPATPLGPGP